MRRIGTMLMSVLMAVAMITPAMGAEETLYEEEIAIVEEMETDDYCEEAIEVWEEDNVDNEYEYEIELGDEIEEDIFVKESWNAAEDKVEVSLDKEIGGVSTLDNGEILIYGDYQYHVNDDGVSVTIDRYDEWKIYDDPNIPASIEGMPVTAIGDEAFNSSGFYKVSIPNTVKTIGNNAFLYCRRLKELKIPDGVTSIGEGICIGCEELAAVTIPSSVVSFGERAFYDCKALRKVTFSEGLETIGAYAFCGCTELTEIIIPKSVKTIEGRAFLDCTGLTGTLEIPNGVETIGACAFCGCTELTEVTIPGSVKTIGEGAFYDCSGLTKLTILDGVMSIGDFAFYDCINLKGNLTIPNGVKTIGEQAFAGCKNLSGVTIPNTVKTIGEYAFVLCDGVLEITIPSSVKKIGEYALADIERIILNNVVLDVDYELCFKYYRSNGSEIEKIEKGVKYNEKLTMAAPTVTPKPTPTATPEPTKVPTVNPKFKKTKLYTNKGAKINSNFDEAGLSGKVTYKSSNTKVATIDSKGKITAKGVGTAKITATFNNKKYTCKVYVYNPAISGKSSVKKGKSITLTIKNGRGTTKWSTSNKNIATVDKNGKVKGKKKGTVTITAVNNGKTIKKKITIK